MCGAGRSPTRWDRDTLARGVTNDSIRSAGATLRFPLETPRKTTRGELDAITNDDVSQCLNGKWLVFFLCFRTSVIAALVAGPRHIKIWLIIVLMVMPVIMNNGRWAIQKVIE